VIRVLNEPSHRGRGAARRVLLLPPAYARAEDFLSAGFVAAVRERALDLDLLIVEPQFTSVTDRSALDELDALIGAARGEGCTELWLGGISLGAFLALGCAERQPGALEGLCLFAPYLGSHLITGEIERAGGLEAWEPGVVAAEDEERRIWRFLKRHAGGPPSIHLGLGRDDRYRERHETLAGALGAQRVEWVPGGHEWPVWRRLWEGFLDVRFPRTCA
jgi:pimeloyl-ACP methyl ester carboxylesterase